MLLNAIFRNLVERMFPAPVEYDILVTETGENPEEPRLVVKYFKDEKLIYYMDYDLEHSYKSVRPSEADGPGKQI